MLLALVALTKAQGPADDHVSRRGWNGKMKDTTSVGDLTEFEVLTA
jgi:hypothetical protein